MAGRKDIDRDLLALAQQHLPRELWVPWMLEGEAATVAYFISMTQGLAGQELAKDDGLPDLSHIELEFPLPRGKADIVVFHEDGGATVIEAKDGSMGRRSVLAGIGQVVSYAYQLGASRAAPKYVQKALMWSPCPDAEDDIHIIDVCRSAGILPMPSARVDVLHQSSEELIKRLLSKAGERHA